MFPLAVDIYYYNLQICILHLRVGTWYTYIIRTRCMNRDLSTDVFSTFVECTGIRTGCTYQTVHLQLIVSRGNLSQYRGLPVKPAIVRIAARCTADWRMSAVSAQVHLFYTTIDRLTHMLTAYRFYMYTHAINLIYILYMYSVHIFFIHTRPQVFSSNIIFLSSRQRFGRLHAF